MAASCCFVDTKAVTNMYLGLLLCALRAKHSAPRRIFKHVFFLAAAETLLTGHNGMGSRNQPTATRTGGFESFLLSHQPVAGLFGKAAPLEAAVSSTKAAVFLPRTLTVVDVQRLGGRKAAPV